MSSDPSFRIDRHRVLLYSHLHHQGQRWEEILVGIGNSLRGFLSTAANCRSLISVSTLRTYGRLGRWNALVGGFATKFQADVPRNGYPDWLHSSLSSDNLGVISPQENVPNSLGQDGRE